MVLQEDAAADIVRIAGPAGTPVDPRIIVEAVRREADPSTAKSLKVVRLD